MTQEDSDIFQDDEWTVVSRYCSLSKAYDGLLVVLAMGQAGQVDQISEETFHLSVHAGIVDKATAELAAYEREIEEKPTDENHLSSWLAESAGTTPIVLWAALLCIVLYWQTNDPNITDWGASSSHRILVHHEWWRPFTALFLHADLSHLVGNIVGGAVFTALCSKLLGAPRAWFFIILCGVVGNTINAVFKFPLHYSAIGASSAVFGALGILTGAGVAETYLERIRLPFQRVIAPFLGGLVMFSWLGLGTSEHVDLSGHIFGFGCGLITGIWSGVAAVRTETDEKISKCADPDFK